ncbi:MAG TPA: carbohydrate ABC transporter permease [Chloroflexota bacterium]|nr:carbohydrate ABC transporter permease [Chloroflexota bacterium]
MIATSRADKAQRLGVGSLSAWRRKTGRAFLYLFLWLFAFIFLFPFYTMLVGAFMPLNELFAFTPNLYPAHPTLDNFVNLFQEFPFWRNILNSLFLAAGQTIGVLFFCSLAGFTFAKRRFPGREGLFVAMLASMMIPQQSTIIPWYLLMARLHWLDTFLPLWIPWWAPAFGIFLMRQFIAASVPDEILEAGIADGCSLFELYWRIVLPVIVPALTVLGILQFIEGWNAFLYPLLVLTSKEMLTAPLALAFLLGSSLMAPQYTWLFAGSALATFPLIVVYFVFQRQLMEGIMSGAIKG